MEFTTMKKINLNPHLQKMDKLLHNITMEEDGGPGTGGIWRGAAGGGGHLAGGGHDA